MRPDTPPVRAQQATFYTTKRSCNGCGRTLGDATVDELRCAIEGSCLPDVRHECGCLDGTDDPWTLHGEAQATLRADGERSPR